MASRRATTTDDVANIKSADGTMIAVERVGSGPPVVCVDAALCTRLHGPGKSLAPVLASRLSVYTYDRRGRGDSGDTGPYAVEREVEDLAAVITEAGGRAHVFGHSSGGVLALEAAARGVAIDRLAVYETPFVVDDTRPPVSDDFLEEVEAMLAAERSGAAIKRFMTEAAHVPAFIPLIMSLTPVWPRLKKVAHTLPYDIRILADYQRGRPLPASPWGSVTVPTLLIAGGKSPAWMKNAVRALAEVLPNAEHQVLEGQTHMVKPKVTGPVLLEFFTAATTGAVDPAAAGRSAA